MRALAFWQKILNMISPDKVAGGVLIRPNPSGAGAERDHLVSYEIPLTENFGDC